MLLWLCWWCRRCSCMLVWMYTYFIYNTLLFLPCIPCFSNARCPATAAGGGLAYGIVFGGWRDRCSRARLFILRRLLAYGPETRHCLAHDGAARDAVNMASEAKPSSAFFLSILSVYYLSLCLSVSVPLSAGVILCVSLVTSRKRITLKKKAAL